VRTGAAADHHGYLHEAVFYRTDDELLDVAVPFLLDGIEAGEPTLVGFGAPHAGLLRAALPDLPIEFLAAAAYARPASAIAAYRRLLAQYVAAGAQQIRLIGGLTPGILGNTWEWWARYESAVNELYDEYPLWSMCAYDTRITSAPVLDDVARTHPSLAEPAGRHAPSMAYMPPAAFLTAPRACEPDPLQCRPPAAVLTDPTLSAVRQAVEAVNSVGMPDDAVDRLKLAVNEVVANAQQHGHPPVEVRYWAGDGRIVVTVTNKGDPPADPFAGLRPAAQAPYGGLGLWLVHQICDYVRLDGGLDGFTVTLTVGTPR
jgi:anti-sigma regulatory factor (Ser/Thr protein kinase)